MGVKSNVALEDGGWSKWGLFSPRGLVEKLLWHHTIRLKCVSYYVNIQELALFADAYGGLEKKDLLIQHQCVTVKVDQRLTRTLR